jgi:hypothetical protein
VLLGERRTDQALSDSTVGDAERVCKVVCCLVEAHDGGRDLLVKIFGEAIVLIRGRTEGEGVPGRISPEERFVIEDIVEHVVDTAVETIRVGDFPCLAEPVEYHLAVVSPEHVRDVALAVERLEHGLESKGVGEGEAYLADETPVGVEGVTDAL